ncbi:hypothetical protein J2S11_000462 [Bacillus horti]|uniref:Uncharacterized protein n=1 Tax=Caldalkalibacillus horti TaxID=77523 RepID=A0ABT9VU98_9BACI|nr:hypothetical protein [Bacillus horti]
MLRFNYSFHLCSFTHSFEKKSVFCFAQHLVVKACNRGIEDV